MKRFSFLMLVLLLLTSCSAGNSNSDEEKKQHVIGFSQIGAESSWRERNTESVLEAGKRADYKILYENANQSQAEQIKDVRSFIASRVDLIILTPIVETGWKHVLEEAADADIPVVTEEKPWDLVAGAPKVYRPSSSNWKQRSSGSGITLGPYRVVDCPTGSLVLM